MNDLFNCSTYLVTCHFKNRIPQNSNLCADVNDVILHARVTKGCFSEAFKEALKYTQNSKTEENIQIPNPWKFLGIYIYMTPKTGHCLDTKKNNYFALFAEKRR